MDRRNVLHQLLSAPVAASLGTRLGALGLASVASGSARAQVYPDRPVRIVVGYPAGAGPDVEARQLAAMLQLELGQPLLVENKPGVSGLLGLEAVSKAAPDGYTLGGATPSNLTGNPRLFDRPLFNAERDLAPVTRFIEHPWLLYVNAKLPAHTLADFIALAKASPGRITYASNGVGGLQHLTGEWLQKLTGIRLTHVPYGSANWQTDVVAGTVDATFYPLITLVDHVRSGKLRALAVASAGRSPVLPDVPTFAEAGYPAYAARAWGGLVAPGGTPAAVIERLAQASARAVQRPEFRDFTTRLGAVTPSSSSQDFGRYVREERAQYHALIAENSIRME
jgi:tripartite-type tricarboxylate transporter receptor subunit TctC